MATAQELINASLRDIGVLAAGETPAYDDSADALDQLNRLIDQWKAERLQIYTITRSTWTIVASQQQYTFGTGGDVSSRPVEIDRISFIDTTQSPNAEFLMDVLTEQAWQDITLKDQTSLWPQAGYYNPVFPQATLDLWPVPTSSDLTGVVYWPEGLSTLAALTTDVNVPPGYERMIVKELAVELSPSYGTQPSNFLVDQARDAKTIVKRANKRMRDLSFDRGALIGTERRTFDIYKGTY